MVKKKRLLKEKVISKIGHVKKPEGLSLEQWQILLRKQIAKDQRFKIENIGTHPVFSDFSVRNPETQRTYRVSIGGEGLGVNYCSCPDFAVNTIGTCKHVESVLDKLRRQKGGRTALREGAHWDYSVVTLRYGLQRKVAFSSGRKSSEGLKALAADFFDQDRCLTAKGFANFDRFVKQAGALKDDVRYHDDALEFIANVRDEGVRRERVHKMFPQQTRDPGWGSLIKADLYSYQREGVLFAASAGRCLIADEMGLGKTIQAIAAGEVMARCFGIAKVIIVCPASLKYQWKREIERFTDRDVKVIQGISPQRQRQYGGEEFFKVVNYDVIHRDLDVINQWGPDLVILDEAQRIKNWKTRMAQSVKQLKSPYVIVLTGTPLENRLEELHSIVGFIDRHHLGPLFRFLDRHQQVDEEGRVVGYRDLHELGRSLDPIMIRRRRGEVLKQLPGRMDKNYFVEMTKEQQGIHEEYRDLAARIVNKWRRYNFLTEEDKRRLMIFLQNMRMVCDNTYLLDRNMIHGNKVNELETQLEEIFEDPDVKVVIFSQWLRMMELVTAMLDVNSWKHVFLNGSVPSPKRGDLVKTFHEDPACRVFLSTEAGSTGLNLQNANVVINMDIPWNPAILEQRISRVHRLGQTRPVRVINFVARGAIEHGMLGLLKFKRSMFSGVLDKGDNNVFMGDSRFNRFMKTVEEATESLESTREGQEVSEEAAREMETARQEVESVDEGEGAPAPASPRGQISQTSRGEALKTALQMGAAFLNRLSECLGEEDREKRTSALEASLGIRIDKDKNTGRRTIQIPVPEEEILKQVTGIVGSFLSLLKK
ncbi:MAG: DEAD/DEAH box helicase [Candidatus Omnitrophica bacterium]|nr:DEAD/DEAH box helicase [Candidatus Omnitrophota bacterium]